MGTAITSGHEYGWFALTNVATSLKSSALVFTYRARSRYSVSDDAHDERQATRLSVCCGTYTELKHTLRSA